MESPAIRADARHRVRANYRDFRDGWNDANHKVGGNNFGRTFLGRKRTERIAFF